MKNLEMRCPVNGTSALQPEIEQVPRAAIIAFPGRRSDASHADVLDDPARRVRYACNEAAPVSRPRRFSELLAGFEMAQALRTGTMKGCAYNCVKPWQAAAAGIVFTGFMLVSVLVGL